MKGFKKLALVTAVAALPMSGFAMEALDDATMSGVTGQDGISLNLGLNASLDIGIEDTDGLGATSTAPNPGMIMIVGQSLVGDADVVIDAGVNATGAVLRIGVEIPTLTLNTGDIHVVAGTSGATVAGGMTNLKTLAAAALPADALIENVSITLSDLNLGIELGDGAANLLAINTTSVLTIDIGSLADTTDSFVLNDQGTNGGGSIYVDQVSIQNVDLNGITANVIANGLELKTNSALSNIDIAMMGVRIGNNSDRTDATTLAPSLGNIYIAGLNMSNQTITISGH